MSADPNAPLPEGVIAGGEGWAFGVPFGTSTTAPVLEIWEDFQCPACQAVEKANGAGIEALAEQGKVRLVWRPTTFLDGNLGNDSSARAVAAWGCAIDAGKSREFHNTVYSNPPAAEGDGFTDDQMIGFAESSGIAGARPGRLQDLLRRSCNLRGVGRELDRPVLQRQDPGHPVRPPRGRRGADGDAGRPGGAGEARRRDSGGRHRLCRPVTVGLLTNAR